MKIKRLIIGEITEEDFLRFHNANVTYEYLPNNINGLIFNYKGINNIFISKVLRYEEKMQTLLHELAHIELNHLNQIDKDLFAFKINAYEDEADKYLKNILNSKE